MIKKIMQYRRNLKTYKEFRGYTMIPKEVYIHNLELASKYAGCEGSVVECGTWRGGMVAGIARLLGPKRSYYLYDSFAGLPAAEKIDGAAAIAWQKNKNKPDYFNNCSAKVLDAKAAMHQSGASKYFIRKGWFHRTLKNHPKKEKIAILRLDADWYKSTLSCLRHLFPSVVSGGLIIIDDYTVWDGCSKALHDYLSKMKRSEKIFQYKNTVSFIIKKPDEY